MGWNHQPEGNNKIYIFPWMAPDPQAEGSTEPKEPEKKEAEVKDVRTAVRRRWKTVGKTGMLKETENIGVDVYIVYICI